MPVIRIMCKGTDCLVAAFSREDLFPVKFNYERND